ncbi:hypothetical protein R3P38DRAFT_2857963 [Favolaschia claudopus]|uniref:Uncharacterized protein n=1 Tax=Favolaschia claudopus TaxID=2862362 RepID=A0AAW0DGL6_9AGAR
MCWFGCRYRCRCNALYCTCAVCNPRMSYYQPAPVVPFTPAPAPPRAPPPSAAFVNPNSPYSVYTTGPPVAAWSTSPGSAVLQYTNGRLHFEGNPGSSHGGGYTPYTPFNYPQLPYYPTPTWYPPAIAWSAW